jgi:hypothetical protein
MTKERMTNEVPNSKDQVTVLATADWNFGVGISFVIRHSDFVIPKGGVRYC